MAIDFSELEKNVRAFWEANNVVEQVRDATAGNEKFFLIDGPPYLTGPPHMGQMQNKVTKDTMLRFKQMQGFHVHDQAGFDTHGLPNELKTEEELGITNKNQIGTEISVAEFIEQCKERAVKAQDVWKDVMWKLAVWQDFDDPYLTYDPDYIESVWYFIASANEQDMLYAARQPIYWCPRCQTSLAGYEVTDEYREVSDESIYVKFPLQGEEDTYLLIWTTTPWTIPGNMAIAVNPEYEYATVAVSGEGTLIIARELVEQVMETAGVDEHDWEITGTFDGASLQGKRYEYVLPEQVPEQMDLDEGYRNVHTVITDTDLVTLEGGTGLVHTASGHGPEDYDAVKVYDIPVFSPVDKEGNYTEQGGAYDGKNVYDANDEIVDDLAENDALFFAQQIRHEYPHCWRCKSRIIYRATRQWFLDISTIKETMLAENEEVDWYPDSAGSKRFHNWLVNAHDWCISRQNYWGIPLPVWECTDCDERVVLNGFDELADKVGALPDDFDPHKHVVDELSWTCECGGELTRVPDNIDVWCDSGCAPFASLHYPFEEEPFESLHPMDFIVEGSDQIRGWFYSLMFCGVTMFDEAPYEQVLLQAFVLDKHGEKMSKSIGNVIDPKDVVEEIGTDIARFWLMENSKQWENAKVDLDEMRQETRRLLNVYWNTAQFLQQYADMDVGEPDGLQPEDAWILSRVNTLLSTAAERYDTCHYHTLCRDWENIVLDDLSRWYVKLVRDRVKQGDRAAIWTLQEALRGLTLVMAPIIPHITEQVYRDLYRDEESVHMEAFPAPDEGRIDEALEEQMEHVREVVDAVQALRQDADMSLRWPARRIVVSATDDAHTAVKRLSHVVKDRANVKEIEFGDVETKLEAKPNYASIGPRFGSDADEVAQHIRAMESEEVAQLRDLGEIWLDDHQVREEDTDISETAVGNVSGRSFNGGEVFLDTEMDTELEQESLIRELIRNIQEARKQAGMEVQDQIDLHLVGPADVIDAWREDIMEQVNARTLSVGEDAGEQQGSATFKEYAIDFGFTKV